MWKSQFARVLIFFFTLLAVANMAVFQMNQKAERKFVLSVLPFGFCLARIVSASRMRVIWTEHPLDVKLAMASSIITAAGVLLLFIVNLMLSHRMVRAYHQSSRDVMS